jgi:translation initiation factor IF-1
MLEVVEVLALREVAVEVQNGIDVMCHVSQYRG